MTLANNPTIFKLLRARRKLTPAPQDLSIQQAQGLRWVADANRLLEHEPRAVTLRELFRRGALCRKAVGLLFGVTPYGQRCLNAGRWL
jgi:hypothetical protein